MTHNFFLKYGTQKIPFDLPDHTDVLQINDPETKIMASEFASGLRNELERLNPDLTNGVAVVLADKTRLCGYPEFLPVLLRTLEEFGAGSDKIRIFIAYGTHPRQSEEECQNAYGESYRHCRFVHHDCDDLECFANKGRTARGTPVYMRRDISDAGFLITFGAISHHYFAGYGGGRKLIFPGLGWKKAIYRNHGLFLDTQAQTLAPSCQSGLLDGNPLAEDLAEFETYRPADMAIHGILDSQGQVRDLLVGSGTAHFRRACADHGENCERIIEQQYDLLIASAGGYPKDVNFIQAHKAIDNAAKFVRDRGTLLMLMECRDGIGSETFLPWFEMGDWNRAFKKLSEKYEGNGGTALSMMSKLRRINISIVTALNHSHAETIGFEKISIEQAHKFAKQAHGATAVIPNASLLVGIGEN